MKPVLKRSLIGAWLVGLSVAVVVLGAHNAFSDPQTASFDTINVKRINVIGQDGHYSLVISDRAHFPGNYFAGKEYKRPGGHRAGGLLFFNDAGDEVGGMTFASHAQGPNYSAESSLLFDQYHQDQTVGLVYEDHDGKRTAGLQIWDRPDYSIEPLMAMNARAAQTASPSDRKVIEQQMLAYAKAHGGVGSKRMFVGKQDGNAIVRLADKQGRPRLIMEVDASGQPSIEFLDDNGKVVRRISVASSTVGGKCCELPHE